MARHVIAKKQELVIVIKFMACAIKRNNLVIQVRREILHRRIEILNQSLIENLPIHFEGPGIYPI